MSCVQSFSQEFKSVPLQACLYPPARDRMQISEILLVERGGVRPDLTNKRPGTPTLTHHLQLHVYEVVRPLRVYKQISLWSIFFLSFFWWNSWCRFSKSIKVLQNINTVYSRSSQPTDKIAHTVWSALCNQLKCYFKSKHCTPCSHRMPTAELKHTCVNICQLKTQQHNVCQSQLALGSIWKRVTNISVISIQGMVSGRV